jgi:hypothetical protein
MNIRDLPKSLLDAVGNVLADSPLADYGYDKNLQNKEPKPFPDEKPEEEESEKEE